VTEPETVTGPVAPGIADQFCPFLGLTDDPATHFNYPSTAQRCHAGARPMVVDAAKQGRDCLTARYPTCSRYVPGGPAKPVPMPLRPVETTIAGGGVDAQPRLARGSRRAGRPVVRMILYVVLLLAIVAGGVLLGTWMAAQVSAPGAPTAPIAPPTAMPSPAVTPSPAPTAPPTATPAPAATPSPTATAAPTPIVHVVTRGENLGQIAAHYGVTVAAIQAANNIKDPSRILIGQKLVIPAP
jgi:LysM repeat protein